MIRTADGTRLRLTRPLIEEILAQRASVQGVTAGLSRLAAGTRRVGGPPRHPGPRRQLFTGRSGNAEVRLLARPNRPGESALVEVSLRPRSALEHEARKGVKATITWETGVYTFQQGWSGAVSLFPRFPAVSGVYIAAKGKKPVYVGESGHVGRRWSSRLRVFQELDLPRIQWGGYKLYVGKIQAEHGSKTLASRHPVDFRRTVERVLIRHLIGKGLRLTNDKFKRRFTVQSPGVSVRSVNPPPFLRDPNPISRRVGITLELRRLYA